MRMAAQRRIARICRPCPQCRVLQAAQINSRTRRTMKSDSARRADGAAFDTPAASVGATRRFCQRFAVSPQAHVSSRPTLFRGRARHAMRMAVQRRIARICRPCPQRRVLQAAQIKATPHNSAARQAMSFSPSAACKFLDLPPVNLRNLHLHLTKNSFAGRPSHLCGVALTLARAVLQIERARLPRSVFWLARIESSRKPVKTLGNIKSKSGGKRLF